jgi:hypothetical protein
MTNVAAVLLSLLPLLLSRARASCDENLSQFEARSFLWENGLPKFIDSHDNLCNLTSNKTRDQVGVRYNVLSFGDSYELEFCRVRPFGLQSHPQSQPHIYGDCSFLNESINYKLHRGYGQQGDPKGTWKWCNESSISAIAKMGKYFDESTSTPSASFGAVVHGSFLWDLAGLHRDWCVNQRKSVKPVDNVLKGTCNHVPGRRHLSSVQITSDMRNTELILQSWEQLTVPWCDATRLRRWQQGYLREVQTILKTFPNAALFLRTQPIASAVFLGNYRCHKPMNDYIAHVAHSFQRRESVNRIDSSHRERSETMVGRVVRLIDLYSLFAVPNDNGVDHFSSDHAHLSKEGFQIYRGFILRVLSDFFNLN